MILLLVACGLGPHRLTTADYDGVDDLGDKMLLDIFDRADEPKHTGLWSPSDGDVQAFESGLAAWIRTQPRPEEVALADRLPTYKRQWVGTLAGERKDLFVNFLCKEETDWTQGLYMRPDGGDCYFQVLYDVDAHHGLTINSP